MLAEVSSEHIASFVAAEASFTDGNKNEQLIWLKQIVVFWCRVLGETNNPATCKSQFVWAKQIVFIAPQHTRIHQRKGTPKANERRIDCI